MSKNYSFVVHTPAYVGANCMKEHADVFKHYGDRAFVITTDFGEFKHYSLEDIEDVLHSQGIKYAVNMDIEENPPVESVKKIADIVREYNPDFLVAVGGGAALDTAKAVSVLLPHPDEDPYEVFWGDGARHSTLYNETTLPIIMAPTTAGTGSEVTAGAVLTREDIDTKLVIYQNVFAELAFLDPRYIKDSPRDLLHAGMMDALSHAIESYVNVKSNDMTRMMGETGMKMFATFKDRVLTDSLTEEDYQNMLIASYYDGMAFQCGTALPHGMGYDLSHFKGVLHGLACGVFQAEYLRSFSNKELVQHVVELCGFRDIDDFADYVQKFISMDVQMECTEEEVRGWAKRFCVNEAHRLERHPEPIDVEGITDIYLKSLKNYIK